MKTDVIMISSEGNNMEAALDQIEKIAAYKGLSPKNAMSLRLLTEEMMAMMRAITGNVNGGGTPQMPGAYSWSMEDYRDQLRQYQELNQQKDQAAWDELEKSVVAKVADDVKVSIRGRTVEMTIIKKLA